MIGEVLNNRYKITADIGDGGMATVYRAVDLTLQREVAIKILHPHLAKDKDLTQRFHQEAAIAARLEHPNIMKIYDYGTHSDKRTFIVAELIRGQDFHKLQVEQARKTGEPYSPIVCAMVGEEILKGLGNAHGMDIVHRDVKPDNVMIASGGEVKLMDFGIAKNTSTSLTLTGHFLGSPSYASPEQVKGEQVDNRSDIYSMGIILYEALTNRLPFSGQSAPEVMMKICQGKYTPLRQARVSLPQALGDIVTKALQLDRKHRYANAEAMARDLRAFLTQCGVQNSRTGLEEYFSDEADFLTRHTLPVQKPRVGSPVSEERPVAAAGATAAATEHVETRRAERKVVGSQATAGANERKRDANDGKRDAVLAPREQEWKDPREIAEALRERAALASTQTRARDLRQLQQNSPLRDAGGAVRDHGGREQGGREARAFTPRDMSFRDTARHAPQRSDTSLITPSFFVVAAVVVLFVGFLMFSNKERKRNAGGETARPPASVPQQPDSDRASGSRAPRESRVVKARPPRRAAAASQGEDSDSDATASAAGQTAAQEAARVAAAAQAAQAAQDASRAAARSAREARDARKTKRAPSTTNSPRTQVADRPETGNAASASAPSSAPSTVTVPASTVAPAQPTRAAEPAKDTRSSIARFTLQTVPGGVPVYLGTTALGDSSRDGTAKTFDAKPGPALLRIPRQQIAGVRYEGLTKKVFLEAGQTASLGVISLTPVRTLSVNITGPGVIVRINGDPYVLKGKPVILNLPEGKVDIEAKASNGKSLKRSIDLRGDNFALNASLE